MSCLRIVFQITANMVMPCNWHRKHWNFRILSLSEQHHLYIHHSPRDHLGLGISFSLPKEGWGSHPFWSLLWHELSWAEQAEENNTQHKARMVWKHGIGKMDSKGRKAQTACLHLCAERTLLCFCCLLREHSLLLPFSPPCSVGVLWQNFGCLPCLSSDKTETPVSIQ